MDGSRWHSVRSSLSFHEQRFLLVSRLKALTNMVTTTTTPHSFLMLCSFTNQVVVQLDSMHAENFVRAVGLHPLPEWSHCTEAGSKRYINFIGRGTGCGRALA